MVSAFSAITPACVDVIGTGSDVIYLNLLGTSIYVLNSVQAINDLLDKRSSIYSDRYDSLSSTSVISSL